MAANSILHSIIFGLYFVLINTYKKSIKKLIIVIMIIINTIAVGNETSARHVSLHVATALAWRRALCSSPSLIPRKKIIVILFTNYRYMISPCDTNTDQWLTSQLYHKIAKYYTKKRQAIILVLLVLEEAVF